MLAAAVETYAIQRPIRPNRHACEAIRAVGSAVELVQRRHDAMRGFALEHRTMALNARCNAAPGGRSVNNAGWPHCHARLWHAAIRTVGKIA
jgi:hypothetical protein